MKISILFFLCLYNFQSFTQELQNSFEVIELNPSDLITDGVHTPVERSKPIDQSQEAPQEEEINTPPEEQIKETKPLNLKKESIGIQKGAEAFTQGKLGLAYRYFVKELEQNRCDPKAIKGLLKVADAWGKQSKKRVRSLQIYTFVYECQPSNYDALFYKGRVLFWMNENKAAIAVLQDLLTLSPEYTDAASLLIKLYIRQKEWQKAKNLLKRFPRLPDAEQDYETIAYKTGNYALSEKLSRDILSKNPKKISARRDLARSLSAQRKFKEAHAQYAILVEDDPQNKTHWREYMNVRSHTRVGILADGSYIKSKENDPDLKAPVVRDYYTLATYHIIFPMANRWRLDLRQIFFHKREVDIYPPVMGTNFNAYVQGAEIVSEALIRTHFKWDLVLRILGARGYNHNVLFPFLSTTRFEPGTSLIYTNSHLFAVINAHVESFIIKNFAKNRSQLLRTLNLYTGYVIKPSFFLNPEFEFTFEEIFYHDNIRNRRNTLNLWGRFNLFTKYLQFVSRFELSNFKQTTPNYFSFKRQIRNTLGCIFRLDLFQSLYIEGRYLHRWEYNVELDQPIGSFNFQTTMQRLNSNRVVMRTGYRLKDKLWAEASGHLFYTTLPYRDYRVSGTLLWQF
ncbi:MAG: hypothetical protein S4CHLAM7_07160 [Chlamydiae bacterium]|nr:hypothetical protein [Chlamydiota bacterium]